MSIARSFGTHDGTFHADEVTACALLLLFDLIDRDKIVRTRSPQKLDACEYVCDVGGVYDPAHKHFDHHQSDYVGALSSAGMVLLYLKEQGKIEQGLYDFFNHALIWGVDAHDTGRVEPKDGICTFSLVIAGFVPIDQTAPKEPAFFEALDFVLGHLRRQLERYRYIHSCRDELAEKMKEGGDLLIFERPIPWLENFFDLDGKTHPAKFIIMPSGEHWKLRGIPPDLEHRMQVRQPLPKEWAGLSNQELKEVSGIEGSIFCHKGRFISIWETKEGAMQAYEYCIRQNCTGGDPMRKGL